ncbi:MAG: transposase, partial [Deltaproteobacteria bacterium]|nr:transposase [Deltaproteobacteria bacterium]
MDLAPAHAAPRAGATFLPSGSYRRREPEATLLYRLVAEELDGLEADLAAASPYGSGLPRHVAKELRAYLDCGRLERGFARVVCRRCRAEHLVTFSCHGRAVCPSCSSRRMHDSAAHLVDRVIPRVPVRQFVVTFAPRVRYHLAADPRLASAALTQVLRVIFAFHRRRARARGAQPARANSTGAVTMVQRFNSALALSLHYHVLAADGVFLRPWYDLAARPTFLELPEPTDDEIAVLLDQMIRRVTDLLRRHGRLDDEAIDEEPQQLLLFAAHSPVARRSPPGDEELPPLCARRHGFSLHAGRAVHANDREGLERLAAYALRPPLAQGRLSLTDDGQVLYRMKRRFSDGTSTITFSPRDFVARLCALVPPPRFHVVKYAGIFSAHARGRYALTGRGLHDHPPDAGGIATPSAAAPDAAPVPVPAATSLPPAAPCPSATLETPSSSNPAVDLHEQHEHDSKYESDADLVGPDDPARARRLRWADLFRR